MFKILRYAGTLVLAMVLASRGISTAFAFGSRGSTEPIVMSSRTTLDVEEDDSDDDDDADTPSPTDNDGYDTPATDYDGIDTPATDNDGVDTPISTDGDGVDTPYTDYDGDDKPRVPALRAEVTANQVELSWDPVAHAERFELWVWDSNEGGRSIGGDSLTSTTFTHSNVVTDTVYYYAIRAVNAEGEASEWADYVSAHVAAWQPAEGAPVLSATAADGEVELSWNTISGAVRYELWVWWEKATGWQQIGGNNLTSTSYTYEGAAAGQNICSSSGR